MNEELEKVFLEEIKLLIDDYERYVDQEMPYSSTIEVNKYKQYTNDEEGKILQSIDEEIEKLVASKMAELTQVREKKIQKKQEEIRAKTQEFVDKSKEEIDKRIKEKKEQMQKKQEEAETYTKEIVDIRKKLATIRQGIKMFKDIDDHIYTAISESEKDRMNDLTEKSRLYDQIKNDYNNMKDELGQLEEKLDTFNRTYGKINFTSENVIDDISKIVERQREKDLSNKPKEREQIIHNPKMRETSDDIKVASLEELEKRRQAGEEQQLKEDEMEQDEDQKVKPVFSRIHVDEAEIETRPQVLTRDDLENEEKQDDSSLNEEDEVDEEKRKLEEEQMWEEYNKEQEEKKEQAKKETDEKLEEHEQKLAKAREKHDKSEAKFYENLEKEKQEFNEEEEKRIEKEKQEFNEEEEKRIEKEKQIREKKEEIFNKKEEGYEDLLKDDLSYQALKERLISTYTLPQLGKALNKKSLVEIYELYVKQVIKDLENTEIIEEGLTEEEMNEKLEEKLANEELKTTLSVRLEMLKERQKEIKERQEQERKAREQYNKREEQATKFFENIEKKYGEDLLPIVYLKDKTDLIEKYAKGENTELLNNFKFLEYCEERLKSLEVFINDPIIKEGIEAGGTLEEIDDYNDLQDKIQGIRAKAIELGEIPPYMQEIKEKLENLFAKGEEGYKDLLPSLYDNFKERYINKAMLSYMNDSAKMDEFLAEYQEKYNRVDVNLVLESCEAVEMCITNKGNYTKGNGEVATAEEIYELRNAIQQIEKRKYIKENAYKETKIVVEPYNDRIMVYLKGEVKPRPYDKLAELMEDGKNLYKSGSNNDGRNLNGSIKGIEIGNYAIIAVLSELGIEKNEDYIEGYTHMFAEKPEKTSKIDSIVYDFTNEGGKIQSQKMIKEMQKYAKEAEKYEVAESIGRKKGIGEKAKSSIGSLLGKGKEKVLALGEGIKGFHPIENAIENKRAKRHSKDLEVDEGNATDTYKKWRGMMGEGAPTQEEQAEFALFKNCEDETREDSRYNREEDEFYSRW